LRPLPFLFEGKIDLLCCGSARERSDEDAKENTEVTTISRSTATTSESVTGQEKKGRKDCDFFTSFLILRIAASKNVNYKEAQRSSKSDACPQRSSEQSLSSGHCSHTRRQDRVSRTRAQVFSPIMRFEKRQEQHDTITHEAPPEARGLSGKPSLRYKEITHLEFGA
ncbi:hypothetical protein KCU85_g5, partial [Aureobasidium melanogenum]